MNTLASLVPVGGRLSRVKIRSSLPSAFVIVEKFELFSLSQSPPNRSITTMNRNSNLITLSKKRQFEQSRKNNGLSRVDTARRQLSSNQDDDHRYRYQLYKYKICPFSNIAKVFLEYQKIPFESVEVNPLTKAELGFSETYRKVPIVTILDTDATTPASKALVQLNGTEEILPHDYNPSGAEEDGFASGESSKRWQDFARNRLATLLYPNICRTLGDSFRAFNYVHSGANSFSALQKYSVQYVGSLAMYFAASKIKEKYKIDDVQIALDEVLAELESELAKSGSGFLGNAQAPHLGDLSVFGVLKGLEGLPLWHTIFDNQDTFPNIRQWYANVESAVETRKVQTSRYGYNN